MTSATYSRPRPVSDIEAATAILRAEGYRISATRRLVLVGLLAAEGPVSAERLAAGIAASDLASVYRNLELLEQLGLVRHVHIGHGPGLYALVTPDDRCYVVCEHCNRIHRLPPAELEAIRERIGEVSGYEAHFSHFPILGLCPACAEQRDRRASNPDQGATMTADAGHEHEDAHSHGKATHSHPHDTHEHDQVEHEHEHSHGDRVHSHPHLHQEGMEEEHEHEHE